jgi:putative addiction module killer protein
MNTVLLTDEFRRWLKALKDQKGRDKVLTRVKRLVAGNMGDAKYFDGIAEMRIDHGPGYRLYLAKRGDTIYVLLTGGDKSSQRKDIEKAKKMLAGL